MWATSPCSIDMYLCSFNNLTSDSSLYSSLGYPSMLNRQAIQFKWCKSALLEHGSKSSVVSFMFL